MKKRSTPIMLLALLFGILLTIGCSEDDMTTETEENAMAAEAIIGFSVNPNSG